MIIDVANDSSVGAARNRGFTLASGEFVVFVDADDEVLPEYLESLHHIFELHPELNVACCNALRIEFEDNIDEIRLVAENVDENITVFERDEFLNRWILQNLIKGIRAAWPYLVRRQYLLDNTIHFPDYSMSEDQIWVAHVIGETKSVGYTAKPLYLYIQNSSSLCNAKINTRERQEKTKQSLQTRKYLSEYFKNITHQVYEAYINYEAEFIRQGTAILKPYDEWLAYLDKYNLKNISPDIESERKFIRKAEQFLFRFNKKLYYIYVRTFAGMPPETSSEKICGAGFRALQSIYHLIK